MHIVLAAGGTAGHINPALALADELTLRGHTCSFIGTPTGIESHIIPEAGYEFLGVTCSGFDRAKPTSALKALNLMRKATRCVTDHLKTLHADGVVGFGAYITVPVARAAQKLGIPYVIHEQNSVPGLANTMIARKAAAVALTYPQTKRAFTRRGVSAKKIFITGNPVRQQILHASREEGRVYFNVPQDALMLLVFGGSLGAKHINDAFVALKGQLLQKDNLYIVHATGQAQFQEVFNKLALTSEEQKRWQVMPYIQEMGSALKACDVCVSRSGATSVAEITALSVPSIVVPYPYARSDHQTTNAQELVAAGLAQLVTDDELDTPIFANMLFELLDSEALRENMRLKGLELAGEGAHVRLAQLVEITL